jgi:hypothetical protein
LTIQNLKQTYQEEKIVTFWKTTLVTGLALGTAITIGAVDTAIGSHNYHSQSYHQHNQSKAHQKSGHFIHPIYGFTFEHPVLGYKFKHPVLGYIPMTTSVQAPSNP